MLSIVGAIAAMALISSTSQTMDRKQRVSPPAPALGADRPTPPTGVWSLVERQLGFYGPFESRAGH